MPLIEVTQSRYVSATIRLDSATANLVDQYAAFVHGSADDVVDKALNYVFAKDREFQEYLKSSRSGESGAVSARAQTRDRRGAEPAANGKAPPSGWRHVVSQFQKLHRYPKNPVRCCAPAESRHSTPRRALQSYSSSSLAPLKTNTLRARSSSIALQVAETTRKGGI